MNVLSSTINQVVYENGSLENPFKTFHEYTQAGVYGKRML